MCFFSLEKIRHLCQIVLNMWVRREVGFLDKNCCASSKVTFLTCFQVHLSKGWQNSWPMPPTNNFVTYDWRNACCFCEICIKKRKKTETINSMQVSSHHASLNKTLTIFLFLFFSQQKYHPWKGKKKEKTIIYFIKLMKKDNHFYHLFLVVI